MPQRKKKSASSAKKEDQVRELINSLAEECILASPSDEESVKSLAEGLISLSRLVADCRPKCSDAIQSSADSLSAIDSSDEKASARTMNDVRRVIAEIQYALEHESDTQSDTACSEIVNEAASADSDDAEAAKDPQGDKTAEPEEAEGILIEDAELAREFIVEANEHFDNADEGLVVLEKDPNHIDSLNNVFRAFHTIKGICGFLNLSPIEKLGHAAEHLLDRVRSGHVSFEGDIVNVTFKSLDTLKAMVSDVGAAVESGKPYFGRPEAVALADYINRLESGNADLAAMDAAFANKAGQQSASFNGIESLGSADKQTVKIDAPKIDLLLDTIGELVIAQSIVERAPELRAFHSDSLDRSVAHLGKITRLLQDMGMSMRMVPIEATFRRMSRLIRDLAKKSDKQIEFTAEGMETELDRSTVEKLSDPLVHLLRNAVDHGIESEEDRIAAGKYAAGHICLRAYHRGGSIVIEIEDDGLGLDRDAIRNKAIERGVITDSDNLTEQEIFGLVFEAGFSTADKLTEVSGRGVGMDVVRERIESLRGNVQIDSEHGKGSTIRLTTPLTTAIIDGMGIGVGDERYIIPVLSIVESIRPAPGMVSTVLGQDEMLLYRDSLLPIARLGNVFGVPHAEQDPTKAIIVIVEEAGRRVAILADTLMGQQQTVIKSMGEGIGKVDGISGACIMADGIPGLILDVTALVRAAGVRTESAVITIDSETAQVCAAADAEASAEEVPVGPDTVELAPQQA